MGGPGEGNPAAAAPRRQGAELHAEAASADNRAALHTTRKEEPPMPYVVAEDLLSEPAGVRFRRVLDRRRIVQMPGAHMGVATLLA